MLQSRGRVIAAVTAVVIAAGAITLAVMLVARHSPSAAGTLAPSPTVAAAGPSPSGRSALQSVSCSAPTSCVAAGFRSAAATPDRPQTLVERWDGAQWSPAPAPASDGGGALSSVACAAAASCVAVGYSSATSVSTDERPLVATSTGSAWSVVAIAGVGPRGALSSVACPTPTSCVAVGSLVRDSAGHRATLVAVGNGVSWSVVPSPAPGTDSWLNAVACTAPTSCVAVGSFSDADPTDEEPGASTLVEAWNGASWSIVPSPDPGTGGEGALLSVTCASTVMCVAVGSYSAVDNPYVAESATLAEAWNGSVWSLVSTPSPGKRGALRSVDCASSRRCVAVGSYETGTYAGNRETLVETWDGSRWSLSATPRATSGSRTLDAIACTSASACVAVGQTGASANAVASAPFAEAWDGVAWSVITR